MGMMDSLVPKLHRTIGLGTHGIIIMVMIVLDLSVYRGDYRRDSIVVDL